MIAANDYVDPALPRMSAVQLRQLIGQAVGLHTYKSSAGLTRAVLENILSAIPEPRSDPGMREISTIVATRYGLTLEALRGPSRKRDLAHPRQEAFYEIYKTGLFSLPQIGAWFGGRDHTTVYHGCRAHAERHCLPHIVGAA